MQSFQENCGENLTKFIRFRRPPFLISKGGRLPDFPNRQSKVRRVREHRDQLSVRSDENNKKTHRMHCKSDRMRKMIRCNADPSKTMKDLDSRFKVRETL